MEAKSKNISHILDTIEKEKTVSKVADNYLNYFEKDKEKAKNKRLANAGDMTKSYYDIVTDFYEYGWGQSFHFAMLEEKESVEHAMLRHERFLGEKLQLKSGEQVLDLGCGIGGPARTLASTFDCNITGANISDYQLERCRVITEKNKLSDKIKFVEADFTKLPIEEGTFDKVYAIEATCHCANLDDVYKEAYRVLKPGGLFGVYEWCMTDAYDPQNPHHNKIKDDILEGNSLPNLVLPQQAKEAFQNVGFEMVEDEDLVSCSPVPWYSLLQPRWTLANFRMTPVGRWSTHLMLMGMEATGYAPKGVVRVHKMLCKGADGLAKGGVEKIFTPMYFMLGRKPLTSSNSTE